MGQLQAKLNARGIDSGPQDGIFGPRTEQAVRQFQRANGLSVDGIVGPETRGALAGRQGAPRRVDNPREVIGNATNKQKLDYAKRVAQQMGLTITSTTGGRHAPNSYHYSGRAIDVAGTHQQMSQFYQKMAQLNPTELFYDPMGGIKNGRNIGAIGGHGDHAHVAF